MNKIYNVLGSLVMVLILISIYAYFSKSNIVQGSVAGGNEYFATTTGIGFNVSVPVILKSAPGTLGSVIYQITPASDGIFTLYDATSSDIVNGRSAALSTTSITLAQFKGKTGSTLGTYTFDIALKYGLMVDFTAIGGATNLPTTTITWR